MSSKEKAKQLLDKFLNDEDMNLTYDEAVKCVEICIYEIYAHLIEPREFEYWGEVKRELSSL